MTKRHQVTCAKCGKRHLWRWRWSYRGSIRNAARAEMDKLCCKPGAAIRLACFDLETGPSIDLYADVLGIGAAGIILAECIEE